MKNLVTKIISILAITMMLINSSLMLVISTAIDAVQSIIDESKINAIYELNLEKYVNYKVGDTSGLMVQANLKTGIEYQDGQEYVPIEATNVILNTPKVNEEYPERVEIVAKSTKATNGDENGKDFNYAYNKDNGEIKLITENKADENGNIYSENVADARDEYQVNLYYGSNCYNDKNEKRELEFSGKLNVALKKDDSEIIKSQNILQKFEVTENVSGLISTNVTTSDIYNGYIHSNAKNDTTYRTEYTENLNIQISYKEIADEVKINTKNLFVNNKDKEIGTEDIVYKSSKINKDEILNELGEEGNLQFLDRDGNCLAEINKDSEADENGYVTVNYENELTELTLKMSKPEKIGEINVQNVKQIKETMKDTDVSKVETKNQISCINNVKKTEKVVDESTGESKDVETVKQVEFYNFENSNLTDIKDAKSDIELSVDNANWTNNVQNDVIFTATLVTNGPEYELFSNPVIQIKLPQEVEKVILGDVALLYDDSLNIKNAKVIEQKGYKILNIELNGIQSNYCLNSIVAGANVVIPATVIISKDAETNDVPVSLTYYNNGKEIETKEGQIKINSITNDNTRNVSTQSAENKNVDLSITSTAQVGSQVLSNGDTVYEEQVIKYTVKATNNTSEDVTGIKISGEVPDGTVYATIDRGTYYSENYEYVKNENVKEYVFNNITELKAGETKEESYEVVVNKLEDRITENNICNKIKTVVNNNQIKEDALNNVVKKAELNIEVKSYIGRDQADSFYYDIYIKNMSDHELKNIEVNSIELQKEMNYKIVNLSTDENTNLKEKSYDNRILKFKLDSIAIGDTANIKFNLTVSNFDENINEQIVKMSMTAQAENTQKYWSNENIRTAYPQYVTITQSSDKEGEKLKYGEEVDYKIEVKNESKIRTYISVQDYLPEGLDGINVEYDSYVIKEGQSLTTTYDINEEKNLDCDRKKETIDIEYEVYGKTGFDAKVLIPAGKILTFNVRAKAGFVTETTEVSNFATVYGNYITSKTSNIIKVFVFANGETPDPNPDPTPTPNPTPDPDPDPNPNPTPGDNKTYDISGTVWVDSNKNGQRDSGENLLSDITVKLYNADTSVIVKDKDGNNSILKTDSTGKYKFNNVENGNYLVLFEFNTGKYEITDYKRSGVSEEINSDVILKNVAIDGEEKNVGLTDKLTVKNSNIDNIDMGLVEKEEFDMSLNKSILNLKVNYDGTEKEYKYNESKLAKVEIPVKKINGASIEVEYQLEVKNEGNADGYVNEIVDYIPEGFSFDSSKNSGWTQKGTNMVVYNEISGVVIKTGESKKISLYLTRNLTSDTIGTLTNKSEINKSISVNGTKDIDSTEGNKNENEDDFSQAQVIISVKTGIVRNISVFIISLLVISLLAYMVKKYKFKGTIMFFVVLVMGTGYIFNQVYAEVEITAEDVLNIRITEENDDGTFVFKQVTQNSEGKWTIEGEEEYTCMDSGYPQCGTGIHFYKEYYDPDYQDETTTEGPTTEKNVTFSMQTKAEDLKVEQIDGKYKIGPYTVKSNYAGKISIEGSATLLDDTLYTFSAGGNSNTQSVNCVTNGLETLNYFNIEANGTYTFYVYVDSRVKKLNNIAVSVEVQDVQRIHTTGIEYKTYYCYKVGDNHSEGRHCRASDGNGVDGKDDARPNTNGGKFACQRMLFEKPVDKTEYTPGSKKVDFGALDIVGNLKIVKKDKDTGDLLKGVKFTVTGPNKYKKENLYTDDKGEIKLTGLLPGKYTVEETETIENYNLKLQDDEDKKITVEVTAGKTTTGTLYNRQYGSFNVIKHDKDTTVSSLGGEKLAGIGFKVFIMKGKEKKYLRNIDLKDDTVDKYCYDDFNINEDKKDTAKTFVTGSDAKFTVKNLPVYYGKNKIKYYIEEYSLPENLKEFYDIKKDIDSIELLSNKNYSIVINNPQKYLQIAGYVWDDVANNNKGTLRNDLYESPETRVEGVTVNLKDKDGNIISTKKTNSNGEYRFKRVKIEELPNYYVEFEYNGLKYTNVKANFDKENGSKAIEKSDDRTGFNNSYATIKGGNSKNNSNTKGYTVDNSGNTKYDLMYKNGTYSSSLVQNTGYTVSSAANYVSAQGVFITASTRAANYSLDKWDKGVTEIANVNLGLYEREQPDLAISTDMSNIDMNINGYDHRYMGNIRSNYIKAGLPDVALNPGYSALLDGFNTSIKNNAGDYRDKTYSRGIYDAYIAYTKDNLNDEARLKVYVTYRIAIKNESTVAYVKAKSVRNYADTQLNFIDSYIEDGTNTDKKVTWKNVGKTGDSKRNIWESGEVDMYIEPGKIANVYLTYELNKDAISKLALLQPNGGNAYILSNTSEITSYSSYDSGKKAYAGIDKDSAPGNITFGDVNTYEDDTDSAPDINITRKPSKNIAGLVFEDEATLTLTKERIGDGRYDNGNNTVNDVQVDLIKFDGDNNHSNDSVIVLYSLGSDGQVIKKDASVKSSNGGKFEFDGIIPGEYAIKYTYGKKDSMQSKIANKDVTTQDYKSTIITNDKFKKAVQNNSEYWYEDTSLENYSSALDDWNLRTNINRNLKDITYSVKNNYDTNADDVNNHYMIASTGKMTFPIEETKGQTTNYGYREPSHTYNIKFGIVVRPKQMLTVKKEISYIKLTLQNGMVLVEGDPRTTKMNYVTYPQNGMLKIEVDNEIIQGSRIEVKYTISVTNNSEIDYNTESYYKYGTRGSNPISLRINSIVDYMDDALETYYNENSSDWKLKTGSDIKDSIAQNVYTTIKNKKNIFVNDWNTEIKPNETKSVDIEASKVLSSSEDNLYENYTEIIGASNDGGKFYGDETKNYTPGNFNFTDDTHESDDSFVKFTIVPSTGDNSIIYYIVGISCLIVIAGGVIIIKKFVL